MKTFDEAFPKRIEEPKKYYNVELENTSYDHDYWCDTYVSYAEWEDGTPLTERELEAIPDDELYEMIMDWLF